VIQPPHIQSAKNQSNLNMTPKTAVIQKLTVRMVGNYRKNKWLKSKTDFMDTVHKN